MLPDEIRRMIEAERDPREFARGHPTAPGYREDYVPRVGRPSPGNGQPGLPKLWPGREGQLGFPAQHGAPVQPGTVYDGLLDDDDST